MEMKAKINKQDLIKLRNTLLNEENYKQGGKAPFRMWEDKANETGKKLIAKIYNQLM